MTQKEKATAYDEAVKRAKKEKEKSRNLGLLEFIEDTFPELRDSEDEKARKELISFLQLPHPQFVGERKQEKWIDWLEKQVPIDEEKVLIGARKDVALSIMNFLNRNTLGMDLSSMECADLESAVIDSDWSKVYDYMKKKLENQGEKPQGKTALETIKEEKIDNANYAKPTNSVKPNFKIGDTIVDKDFYECGTETIKDIKDGQYIFTDGYGINIDEQEGWQLVKASANIEKKPMLSDFFNAEYERGKADALKSVEWSEEDEKMLNDIDITLFEENSIPNAKYWKFMNWLKSLKDRVHPQKQWKPSKEQMEALKEVCDKRWELDGLDPLYTLYEYLKKLTE